MNPPKVSVLIPTYNYAHFLAEAIESVLAQDFQDFELLIMDDCSSDNTAEVARPFCARDARVRFAVNAANLGMVNNWNHCLEEARGQYVKFLFGDDKLSAPKALGKMAALLRDNPSAMLAASGRLILDEKSNVISTCRRWRDGIHQGRKIIEACLMEDGNLIGEPSAVLFRKSDAGRFFDPKYRQVVDLEMWFYLLEKGDLVYTREPLCAFRQHGRQQSAHNAASGLARKEHALFFTSYAAKPWLPPKARFSVLYALRRSRRKNPGAVDPELAEAEQLLAGQLGKRLYAIHWTGHKLTAPFHNLKRSMDKARHRSRA